MKQLEDMTEPELKALTRRICNAVKERLPKQEVGFVVLYYPVGTHGVWQYGSNCSRADMIKALRDTADILERKQDVPR